MRKPYTEYKKLHVDIRLVAEASLLGTIFGFFGAYFWLFDLFAHFHLHYCITLSLLAVWLLFRRMWLLALLMLPLITVNAAVLLSYHQYLVKPLAPISQPQIHIAAANLMSLPIDPAAVKAYFSNPDIDIALLSEYSVDWDALFRQWQLPYAYSATRPQPDSFGIALLSKWPLSNIERQFLRYMAQCPAGVRAANRSYSGERPI